MAGSDFARFASPIDMSGGLISCTYVEHPTNSWDARAVKAALRYAKWLVDFAG